MNNLLNLVGPWLVGLLMFGTPVLLAWWLSDGFKARGGVGGRY